MKWSFEVSGINKTKHIENHCTYLCDGFLYVSDTDGVQILLIFVN